MAKHNARRPFHTLDPNLEQFATERQWEMLKAWEEHGSARAAADSFGINPNCITAAWKFVKREAARRGYFDTPAAFAMPGQPLPEGFELRGQSVLTDASGGMQRRWDKTRQSGQDPEDTPQLADPKKIVKLSKFYDSSGKVLNYWVSEKPELAQREQVWRDFAAALAQESTAKWEPLPEVAALVPCNENLLSAYFVGDHHIGMLAWGEETLGGNYDLRIAEELLNGAIDNLCLATPRSAEGLVVFMGDLMHFDGLTAETPTGRNRVDADSRYGKMVRTTIRCARHAIGRALERHDTVRVIVEPGNHDLSSMIFLVELLANFYEHEKRVIVDTAPSHFHYYEFGKCLIGVHHGHGPNLKTLPLVMASDQAEAWGRTSYRYWWTGHVHHDRIMGDATGGCRVESVRVLATVDAWASQKGFRSARDMKAVVYDRRYGEVARYTVNPVMLEDENNGSRQG